MNQAVIKYKSTNLGSPTNDTETTVKIVDAELPTVTSFKYLASLFTSEGCSEADVNNRIRISWMKWKEVSGIMCDRRMLVALKGKVFNQQTSNDIQFWVLGRKEERWEQTKFSQNEDVEMGQKEHQVGPNQKWRHQEGGTHKTCWNFPGKQKTKVVWPVLEARTQPHLCEIAATRSFW